MLAFDGVRRVLNLVEDGEYRRGERDAVQARAGPAGSRRHRCG